MLRILIVTGLLLMAVGFGAAGWQYWQGMAPVGAGEGPVAKAAPMPDAKPQQGWLISPTGGLVPRDLVRAYLVQDRYVPDRVAVIRRSARLADLLAEGEKLPATPYLQVLADIRAPKVGETLCAVLLASLAADCAVNQARVEPESVDPVTGTARFTIELVFREKLASSDLPDLAAHVLQGQATRVTLEPGLPGTESADAALAAAVDMARTACQAETVGQACRVRKLAVDWRPGQPVALMAEVAWLDPLPDGVFAAPPLDVAPTPEG